MRFLVENKASAFLAVVIFLLLGNAVADGNEKLPKYWNLITRDGTVLTFAVPDDTKIPQLEALMKEFRNAFRSEKKHELLPKMGIQPTTKGSPYGDYNQVIIYIFPQSAAGFGNSQSIKELRSGKSKAFADGFCNRVLAHYSHTLEYKPPKYNKQAAVDTATIGFVGYGCSKPKGYRKLF
jgi:hypothetical protein